MQAQNPYEKKYKQLNLLGKGNFGIISLTQAKSTKCDLTMVKRVKMQATLWPKKCSLKASHKKRSGLHMERYLLEEIDLNFVEAQQ